MNIYNSHIHSSWAMLVQGDKYIVWEFIAYSCHTQ